MFLLIHEMASYLFNIKFNENSYWCQLNRTIMLYAISRLQYFNNGCEINQIWGLPIMTKNQIAQILFNDFIKKLRHN